MDDRWKAIIENDPEAGAQDTAAMVENMRARAERAAALVAEDPKLPYTTALTIAGDQMGAERSKRWMAQGMPFEVAYPFVGSYARFAFAVEAFDDGLVERDWFFDHLPELWTGADVGHADRYLQLWWEAFDRNGHEAVTDGEPLPKGRTLRLYRGQDGDVPPGISWTLDQQVAEKFARGAATRQGNRGGTVFEVEVPRTIILGYLTGRGEREVIIDPSGMFAVTEAAALVVDGTARGDAMRALR